MMGSESSTGGAHPGLPGEGGRRAEGFLRPDDLGGEVVELPVLLTGRQVAALEEVARRGGLTVAQLVRRILRSHLGCESTTETD
jgi:hypothetical protein